MADLLADLIASLRGPTTRQGCALPPKHSCVGGWHLRWRDGIKTAYERCGRAAFEAPTDGEATFATFDASREPEAVDAMKRLASGEARKVALLPATPGGAPGCGKTHLMRAAMAELQRAGKWCVWLDGDWKDTDAYPRWLKCDALFIDNVGREGVEDGKLVSSVLCELLDDRKGATALSSNLGLEQFRRYSVELKSRVEGMERPKLNGVDYRRP